MTLIWETKKVKIRDLKDYPINPRKITKKKFDDLKRSLNEDGYHKRIMVDIDNVMVGGHQKKKALLSLGLKESDEIEVLYPNRKLTQIEMDRINIRDNLSFGSFDFDILSANHDLDFLVEEVGMEESALVGLEEIYDDRTPKEKKEREPRDECDCDCCKH